MLVLVAPQVGPEQLVPDLTGDYFGHVAEDVVRELLQSCHLFSGQCDGDARRISHGSSVR